MQDLPNGIYCINQTPSTILDVFGLSTELDTKMKFFCKENHWLIIKGRLILKTPTGKDYKNSEKMVQALEAQIRQQISNEIMEMPLLQDRKAITKQGLDNALLTTQSLCAQRALYGIPKK